ncbi:winged helix-turn-helix domain-containing protein [Methylorubrum suomiense]|uniref:OmpR/PhoB-type domain-containing protein n=1 Tax=Methylorubrum suomiense TaxID=144191 RepID=A0ABQ4UYA7_9HYPH|nr:winged helix-turn-helix domain-containing protein [Methylorubrum suomiense]GJE77202.1 hypothetical protein BGCPKDLD_3805 [Methylorubrum suomiense]
MNMHRLDATARHLARLVEENETLREEVRQLREQLEPSIQFPRTWRLTQSESRILCALYAAKTRIVTRESAVIASTNREDDLPDLQILSVSVSRIRTKLRRVGLTSVIETAWGIGYHLSADGVIALNKALAAEQRRQDALDASLRAGRGA